MYIEYKQVLARSNTLSFKVFFIGLHTWSICSAVIALICIFAVGAGAANGNAPTGSRATNAPKSVAVSISFEYKNFAEKIQLFYPTPESRFDVFATGIEQNRQKLPITKPYLSGSGVSPGRDQTLVLVIENKSQTDSLYFFASPHLILPPESALGQRFDCLCKNAVFRIPPKSFWYRVVRVELADSFKATTLDLRHSIVGLDEATATGKYASMLYNYGK